MLLVALQCEISIFEFWEMTYGEIILTVEAYRKNKNYATRETASFNYSLANLVGLSVARLIDKKAKYPTLKEAYPNIFNDLEDKELVVENADVTKARFLQYAEANNKKKR